LTTVNRQFRDEGDDGSDVIDSAIKVAIISPDKLRVGLNLLSVMVPISGYLSGNSGIMSTLKEGITG
jgi:hypothetical protein